VAGKDALGNTTMMKNLDYAAWTVSVPRCETCAAVHNDIRTQKEYWTTRGLPVGLLLLAAAVAAKAWFSLPDAWFAAWCAVALLTGLGVFILCEKRAASILREADCGPEIAFGDERLRQWESEATADAASWVRSGEADWYVDADGTSRPGL